MNETLFSIDIETSGPEIGRHSMLQLGACRVDEPRTEFQILLKPISDDAVPAAMEIVGKPLAFFRVNGRDPHEAMKAFEDWVAESAAGAQPVFLGFNAAFDWGFVNWYFLKFDVQNPFGVSPLDIKAYYAGLTGSAWDDTRSSRLPVQFRSAERHTHDALADAREQADMFRRMRDSR